MLQVFRHADFLDKGTQGEVSYGFYGRQGGVSHGIYQSLNCGLGSDDVAADIQENRSRVAIDLKSQGRRIFSPYQVHGNKCVKVTSIDEINQRPKADAVVTNIPNLPISVVTADCVPVLFHAKHNGMNIVGAAHAGWRGAITGILQETVRKICDYAPDIQPNMVSACIGPCITKKSYQVDEQFRIAFLKQDALNDQFFVADKKGKYLFDLPAYCKSALSSCGVSNICYFDQDTYSNPDSFFSYRRATHDGTALQGYGRQISAIMIKEQN